MAEIAIGAGLGALGGAAGGLLGGAVAAGVKGGLRSAGRGFAKAASGMSNAKGGLASFKPRNLGKFVSGSARNIAREAKEIGGGRTALAWTKDIINGARTPDALAQGALATVFPGSRADGKEMLTNGYIFKPQNAFAPILSGGFA